MGFSCGIVGLPNVGKSTLYNALTKSKVASSNYPFCTIDRNIGMVNVPDERLLKLSDISKSKSVVPTTVEFVDIAGLVKGAAEGEGLGNQFLSHIRDVDAIVQVVRIFEDTDVIHIGDVDPIRDLEIINTELMLKDIETVENVLTKKEKMAKTGNKEAAVEAEALGIVKAKLGEGVLVRNVELEQKHRDVLRLYQLLTDKPFLICANVGENDLLSFDKNPNYLKLAKTAASLNCDILAVSAKIEQEISELSAEEAKAYLGDLGLEKSGLERLIIEGYKLLDLITFFTSGEKESRAWTISKGMKAPQAAGKIHTDFEKGFIRAETSSYGDFVQLNGWNGVKEKGLMRLEGKDYIVQDGDVMLFRFSV